MDEKLIIDFMIAQVEALHLSALKALPLGHPAIKTLEETSGALKASAAPLPDGFASREEYHTFLAEQVNQVFEGHDFNDVAASVQDVVGAVPDEDGNYREIGNIDAAVEASNQLVAEFEQEVGEPIRTENTIAIEYTRLNGTELTEADVQNIINHPISDTLRHLGNIQLLEVEQGEDINIKKAVFLVLEEGKLSLRNLAVGATAYRGVSVIPGLGRIQAIGSVNFAD